MQLRARGSKLKTAKTDHNPHTHTQENHSFLQTTGIKKKKKYKSKIKIPDQVKQLSHCIYIFFNSEIKDVQLKIQFPVSPTQHSNGTWLQTIPIYKRYNLEDKYTTFLE